MVEYKYDGYGNIISIIDRTTNNIGEKNPYRYRSYYFDTETSWYYLNSRYYDSSIGRFITMDEVEYLGVTGTIFSCNLYSYCEGNPVVYEDDDGNAKELLINQSVSNFADYNSDRIEIFLFARRMGKTPPSIWPGLPPNLGGKKPKWNPNGYWKGKNDNYVWDPSHGGGVDRGEGKQGGHWDGEKTGNRYREDGTPLPGNKTTNNSSIIPNNSPNVIINCAPSSSYIESYVGIALCIGTALLMKMLNDDYLSLVL